MGASGWDYRVPYQADLGAALGEAQRRALAEGDYWWADRGEVAANFEDRPKTFDELIASEEVRESGTHSILDMGEVLPVGSEFRMGGVLPLTEAEVIEATGVTAPTGEHTGALERLLPEQRWGGRCAVLHDAAGNPSEIYFWGVSGD